MAIMPGHSPRSETGSKLLAVSTVLFAYLIYSYFAAKGSVSNVASYFGLSFLTVFVLLGLWLLLKGAIPTPLYPRFNALSCMPFNPYSDAGNRLRVFIAHSSIDKPFARIVYRLVKLAGAEPWFDEASLLAGTEFDRHIEKALRESDICLVLLSKGSMCRDGYFHREIRIAERVASEKPPGVLFIVPFALDDCEIPDSLGKLVRGGQFKQILKSFEEAANGKRRESIVRPESREFGDLLEQLRKTVDASTQAVHDSPATPKQPELCPEPAQETDDSTRRSGEIKALNLRLHGAALLVFFCVAPSAILSISRMNIIPVRSTKIDSASPIAIVSTSPTKTDPATGPLPDSKNAAVAAPVIAVSESPIVTPSRAGLPLTINQRGRELISSVGGEKKPGTETAVPTKVAPLRISNGPSDLAKAFEGQPGAQLRFSSATEEPSSQKPRRIHTVGQSGDVEVDIHRIGSWEGGRPGSSQYINVYTEFKLAQEDAKCVLRASTRLSYYPPSDRFSRYNHTFGFGSTCVTLQLAFQDTDGRLVCASRLRKFTSSKISPPKSFSRPEPIHADPVEWTESIALDGIERLDSVRFIATLDESMDGRLWTLDGVTRDDLVVQAGPFPSDARVFRRGRLLDRLDQMSSFFKPLKLVDVDDVRGNRK